MNKEEQELSKVTYHAGNLIPNVIPSPKLAKPKKVSKSKKVKSSFNTSELDRMIDNASQDEEESSIDDLYPSAYREMLRRQENDRANGEGIWTEGSYSTGTRTGRRTKAQIQEDRIAEQVRRQEAGQRITRVAGFSITPICECESNETIEHRRGKINGKMKFICNECELEWISNASLSL